ncbi:Flavoprotein [Mycena venus]|uniref:Flavoprotein n=1 Tax=Mycena venus TaxID=2733690 RepID=A0A8H7DES2_9AGAR|nr:Flavoprotein [Mycena venus]
MACFTRSTPPVRLNSGPVEILLVICGAGPLRDVSTLLDQVLHRGWKVQAIATPAAVEIGLDVQAVERQTGRRVVTSTAIPRTATPDGIMVAPATANTLAKLALGIRDTYAAAVLAQAVAARIPMVILPSIKKVDLDNRVLPTHIKNLRRDGVQVLIGEPDGLEPTNASSKDGPLPSFPWHLAVSAMAACIDPAEAKIRPPRRSKLPKSFVVTISLAILTMAIVVAQTRKRG